jgi:hypothetical protein
MNAFITAQGLYKNQYAHRAYRSLVQHCTRFRSSFNGLNMGVRGAALATVLSQAVSCIWGLDLPHWNNNTAEAQTFQYQAGRQSHSAMRCVGLRTFCHDSQRKFSLPSAIMRLCFDTEATSRVGAMTILTSGDAVCPCAPAGPCSGGTAHRKLQLRGGKWNQSQANLLAAAQSQPSLFNRLVGPSLCCFHR